MTVVETDQGQNEFGNAITSLQKYEDPPKVPQLTKNSFNSQPDGEKFLLYLIDLFLFYQF